MKKKILVISGGISKERLISLNTGKQVVKELSKNQFTVKITEPDFKLLQIIKSFKPNIIFNAYMVNLVKTDTFNHFRKHRCPLHPFRCYFFSNSNGQTVIKKILLIIKF